LERKNNALDFPKIDADLEDYNHHNIQLLLAKDENSYFIKE